LKRAVKAWFMRAQKPAKIIDGDEQDLSPEEMKPMLSERIERWSKELMDQGRVEGMAEGKAEGELKGRAELSEEETAELKRSSII
jgi:flagellar biosynthesis/type III secretory pathway protein FliH